MKAEGKGVLRIGISQISANKSRLDRIKGTYVDAPSSAGLGDLTFLESSDAAQAWGISIQALYKRARRGTALGIRTASGRLAFPAFQFESEQIYTGIKRVIGRLPCDNPRDRLLFLLSPSVELGGISPLEAIRCQRSSEAELLAKRVARNRA